MWKNILSNINRIEKRQRFIISALLSGALILIPTFFEINYLFIFIPLIALITYGLSYFAILEGISKHERVMLFIHQVYFSIAIYLFYFFLPQRWLTRIPFVTIYVISMYAILLSQNIFNVGASKSIQLFRAAFSVNYLFLTIAAYMSFSLILSLRFNAFINFAAIFIASMPLVMHFLWSVNPLEHVSRKLFRYAGIISLLIADTAVVLSFLPINQAIFALILISVYYSLCGLFQIYLQGVVYRERVREYLIVLAFTCVIFILSVRW